MRVGINKIGKDRNLGIGIQLKEAPLIDAAGVHIAVQGKGSAADTIVEISLDECDLIYLRNITLTSKVQSSKIEPLRGNEVQDSTADKKINQLVDQVNFLNERFLISVTS